MATTSDHGFVQPEEKLTCKELYEQGSKCCQQYSELTMQIRTLAQYIMIAYTVGISLTLNQAANDWDTDQMTLHRHVT